MKIPNPVRDGAFCPTCGRVSVSDVASIIADMRRTTAKLEALDAFLAHEHAEEARETRDKVLTLDECAGRMRRSTQTLRRGLRDGRYPFLYRDHGRIFASARELDMWERRQLKRSENAARATT
jgi:hypothetical protein